MKSHNKSKKLSLMVSGFLLVLLFSSCESIMTLGVFAAGASAAIAIVCGIVVLLVFLYHSIFGDKK
ncbi:hypothetical protein [Parapedobacter sp.]|uniref:hypothetical protein n=1 Tax=Parapedobacter sp. TaxID=1958893 RepID=UPI002D7EE94D|nr:hypothetical protein [Parapedobacter sp.]